MRHVFSFSSPFYYRRYFTILTCVQHKERIVGTPVLYLFRSSELFVTQYNTLPIDYPDIGEESLLDSMDIDIAGVPSRILLFKDEASRAAVVSASVCGPPVSSDP
ncbi:MAG TPA: hypothetical protein PKH81_04215, partial [Treponemataceae bacterium]|nr:hypothetical protein [Treponemataceae bacterium]